MIKALFFDLDHTLIRPLEGRTFPNSSSDWEFIPGIKRAIKPFMDAGYMFIIISNQGGIEAGHHTELDIEFKLVTVLSDLRLALQVPEARYAFRYCGSLQPHPDRKPNPGMILDAVREYDIDLQASVFVGDMQTDMEAALAAGVRDYIDVNLFLDGCYKPLIDLYE